MEGLMYMKVVLSNKKEKKKKTSFLALCIFIRVQCFRVRQKCVFGGDHEELINEIQRQLISFLLI